MCEQNDERATQHEKCDISKVALHFVFIRKGVHGNKCTCPVEDLRLGARSEPKRHPPACVSPRRYGFCPLCSCCEKTDQILQEHHQQRTLTLLVNRGGHLPVRANGREILQQA